MVKERPILFSAPMVHALLAGTKTQTRRLIKPQPIQGIMDAKAFEALRGATAAGILPIEATEEGQAGWTWRGCRYMPWPHAIRNRSPYGMPGDRLWVKETWSVNGLYDNLPPSELPHDLPVGYLADGAPSIERHGKTRVSIHMTRWASRITLEVSDVRAQTLTEISEEDARAEGVSPVQGETARHAFAALWDQINGSAPWGAAPWVWVVSFRRVS